MYTGGSPRQNIIIKFSKLEERILKAVRKKPTNQPNKQKPNNTWRDPSWPDCWLFSRNLSEWEVVGWDFPKTKRQKLVGWKTAHSKAVPQVWRRDRQLRTIIAERIYYCHSCLTRNAEGVSSNWRKEMLMLRRGIEGKTMFHQQFKTWRGMYYEG